MDNQAFQEILKQLEQEVDKYVAQVAGEAQQNNSEAKEFTEDEWQDFAKEMGLQGGHRDIGEANDVEDFFRRLNGRW